MSRIVATLVYSKAAGSMARKAVLAYFADRANDDGTGIWAAKQRIADEIECSKQTVISTVKALLTEGILQETGRRPNGNGYTVEYAINLHAIEALPESKRTVEGVQTLTGQNLDRSTSLTARGQTALPKPSLNRPTSPKTTSSTKLRPRNAADVFPKPNWAARDIWRDFLENRRRKRLPNTATAHAKLIRDVMALVDDDWPPGRVLEAATARGWGAIYPAIKDEDDDGRRRPNHGMAGHRGSASGLGRTMDAALDFVAGR